MNDGTYEMTCILCPNGCPLSAQVRDGKIVQIEGARCPKGKDYARQEVIAPVRNIASSVLVQDGVLPLCSVRTQKPIPKEKIFDVMAEISRIRLAAPVKLGQVVIKDVCGLGVNVIATKEVDCDQNSD